MKRIFCLLAGIISVLCGHAQWSVGGKAGASWSKVNFPESEYFSGKSSNRTGGSAGAVAAYRFNRWLGVQAEIAYAARGWVDDEIVLTDETGTVVQNGCTTRLNCLDIPVLLRFFPVGNFNLQVGPQLGVILSQTAKIGDEKVDGKLLGDFRPVDFGLVFGVGYEFDFGLFADVRYTLGLTGLLRNFDSGYRSRSVGISLGYRFSL